MSALRKTIWLLAVALPLAYSQSATKKVSQSEAIAQATQKVQPEYPAMARQLKISGAVEVEVVIAENGQVEAVNPVSGNPVLTKPAADAMKKWKFKPFQQDGAAVKAAAIFKFNFSNNN